MNVWGVHRSSRQRRFAGAFACSVACSVACLEPRDARADAATDAATAKELTKPSERRSGLVFGFSVGVGVAGASGYPNGYKQIGLPQYYDGSDAMGGGGGSIFVMGSLADWVSFGAFYSRANFRSGQWYTYGGGGGFRVELFPLYGVSPALRDLALYGQFGVGTSTLVPTSGSQAPANGTESFVGGGLFYEIALGKAGHGHFAAGPLFEVDAQLTQANQRVSAMAGGRIAFYTAK